jgi:protein-histidine pros-kinase
LSSALKEIGDIALFSKMAGMFLAEWDEYLDRVRRAVEASDVHELRMHAHTLKSLLGMFHADVARRSALELESAATSVATVDWVRCKQNLAQLESQMQAIYPELERFVSTGVLS